MDKFEEIKKYKGLLEDGIISKEEFDGKKDELLDAFKGNATLDSLVNGAKTKASDIKEVTSRKIEEVKYNRTEDSDNKQIEIEVDTSEQRNSQSAISLNEKSEDEAPRGFASEGVISANGKERKKKEANRKKLFKKKWFWIVIAALLIFGFFSGNNDDEKNKPVDNNVAVEDQTQDQEPTQDQEQALEEEQRQNENSPVEATDNDKTVNISDDVLVNVLNTSSDWQGIWKVASDRHFAFYPDGDIADALLSTGIYYTQYGEIPADVKESFNYMIESMKTLSSSISDTAGEPCALSILNPANTDNVLITVMDGAVLYNMFDEK